MPGRKLTAAAVLLAVLALIRQAGILFAAGFGLQMAIAAALGETSWKRACLWTLAVALPAAGALSAMVAYDQRMAAGEGVLSNFDFFQRSPATPSDLAGSTLPGQCLEGLRVRVSEVGRLVVPGMFSAYGARGHWLNVNMLVYVPLFALLVVGWWRFVGQRPDAFALTLPPYLALHVWWPFDQSCRFFAPLLPLMLVCFWLALERLGRWRLRLAVVLVAAHLAVATGQWLVHDRPRALAEHGHWPAVRRLAGVIDGDPGAVQAAPGLENARLMLQHVLDRPVTPQPAGQSAPPEVRWRVVPAEALACPGFSPCLTAGPYQLLRREGASGYSTERGPCRPAPTGESGLGVDGTR
jgi:hypothetical protein